MDPIRSGCSANLWGPKEKIALVALVPGVVAAVAGAIFLSLSTVAVASALIIPVTLCVAGGLVALVAGIYLFNRLSSFSLEDSTAQTRLEKNIKVLFESKIKGDSSREQMAGDSSVGVRDIIWQREGGGNITKEFSAQSGQSDQKQVVDSDGEPLKCPAQFIADLKRSSDFKLQNEVIYSSSSEKECEAINLGKAIEKFEKACSVGRDKELGKRIAERLMRCLTQTTCADITLRASLLYVCHTTAKEGTRMSCEAEEGDELSSARGAGGPLWAVEIKNNEAILTLKQAFVICGWEDPTAPFGFVQCKRIIKIPLEELADSRTEGEEGFPQEDFLPNLTVTDTWSRFFSRPSNLEPYNSSHPDKWENTIKEQLKDF